ncbi:MULTISPECIES: hypothetical protein [unclassified Exiguobacterium]|uniref:hypothetical protein n=1 Tax=unclassified Exiguobacterium TaxID=2644629 RepID=UPI001AE97FB4|nr:MULTISPECIES: hypothetical protein [unclassified Exiguobacterium]
MMNLKKKLLILAGIVTISFPSTTINDTDAINKSAKNDLPYEYSMKRTAKNDLPYEYSIRKLAKNDLPYEYVISNKKA